MNVLVLLVLPVIWVCAQHHQAVNNPPAAADGTFLTATDFANAKSAPRRPKDERTNMRHDGDLLSEPAAMGNPTRSAIQRNAVRNSRKLWPNATIPYLMEPSFSAKDKAQIAGAIADIHNKTCIRLVPRTDEKAYLHLRNWGGCGTYEGRLGIAQNVLLGEGCNWQDIVIHEIMHTIGFYHEQSRNDRDDYITVHTQNLEPYSKKQFAKHPLTLIDHLDTPYDYRSIMHYDALSFSKNGRPVMTPKKRKVTLGGSWWMTANDALKINRLYNCSQATTTTQAPTKESTNNGTSTITMTDATTQAPTEESTNNGTSQSYNTTRY